MSQLNREMVEPTGRSRNPWRRISAFRRAPQPERVTLWLTIHASPLSMGIADGFAVRDCWREGDGRWMHTHNGKPAQMRGEYVTHYAPSDAAPDTGPEGQPIDWWRGR